MKPVRGSKRTPSKAPNLKKKRKIDETEKKLSENNGTKPGQKRKAVDRSSPLPKKVKGQENWKLMPLSTVTALENIMDLSILATLALRKTQMKESQEHLNMMKSRFLAQCVQLKVPAQKQKHMECSSYHQQRATESSEAGKKTLKKLESDLKSVVVALEEAEEETESLKQTCLALRDQLEDEEEKAKESLQLREQTVLNLPPHRPPADEPTLEALMRKTIPDNECEATSQRLGEILQNSEAIQNAQVLLLHAHKHADEL
ncbi:centromere protein Q isoform X2 [Solea solea]|uniref:centromere protein Q isoform X2 n=1 Tax=Solea solea TaxID=90069 RepID=UPI00272BE3AB|nr:centromere protein Q isoform X2 [Solea solea]